MLLPSMTIRVGALMTVHNSSNFGIFSNYPTYVDIVVSPPACYLEYTKGLASQKIHTAGQNSYKVAKGAFTGKDD